MSSHIGQSSIEYLSTYGWTILAVLLVSSALYPALNRGCNVSITDSIGGSPLLVEQIGLGSGELKFRLDSESEYAITVNSLTISREDTSRNISSSKSIPPEAEISYSISNIDATEVCNSYDVQLNFDMGPLEDRKKTFTLKGSFDPFNN